jgi:hypothetical protein
VLMRNSQLECLDRMAVYTQLQADEMDVVEKLKAASTHCKFKVYVFDDDLAV